MASNDQQKAAFELLRRRKAGRNIIDYAEFIDVPGRAATDDEDCDIFTPIESNLAQHHKMILNEVYACALRDTGRLMIFMPAGSAKSTYASVVGPSFLMGAIAKFRIGLFSYGSSLAKKMGRRTRSIINQTRYGGAFKLKDGKTPVTLSGDAAAVDNFTLNNGSEYMATGMLGAATGNRFEMLMIDDPVKGREDADSETIREKTWSAYQDDLKTRLVPGGSICIIQCMVGSTMVLMADGTETPLRDIKPGDEIATYENGFVSTSKVMKWANQGSDSVFEIRMISGTIVSANERHPFLVERNGVAEWIRLKNLQVGDKILKVEYQKAHGRGKSAHSKDVTPQRALKDSAIRITTKPVGRVGIEHLRSIQHPDVMPTLNTGMGLTPTLIGNCSVGKTGYAQSANCHPATTCALTGVGNSASIIAMTPEKSEDYSATTATLPLDTVKPLQSLMPLLSTYEITVDTIVEIVAASREDVFDIQVERTENFIANGLVSHNTRWHEDDLSGRILPTDWEGESGDILCQDGNVWRVLCLQAQCETDSDPLGRARGEYLWPEWFTKKHWDQFKSDARSWGSLCQQLPKPKDGNLFNPDKLVKIAHLPEERTVWCRGWDLSACVGGDYTVGFKLGKYLRNGVERAVIAGVFRKNEGGPSHRDDEIKRVVQLDGRSPRQDFPDDPGSAGTVQVVALVKLLKGYPVVWSAESGDKETRALPFASYVNAGLVDILVADWNRALVNEMRAFPSGTYDDQVDAGSRAFARLLGTSGKMQINRQLLQRVTS